MERGEGLRSRDGGREKEEGVPRVGEVGGEIWYVEDVGE